MTLQPPITDYSALVGLRIRLQRTVDRPCALCGVNSVTIGQGAGPHVAGLLCSGCSNHRGWLPRSIADFLAESIGKFGRLAAPITVRTIPKTDREAGALAIGNSMRQT
jgi:hypothetical protein